MSDVEHAAGEHQPSACVADAAHFGARRGGVAIALPSDPVDEEPLRTVAGTPERL